MGVRGWGPTRGEAFAGITLGVFGLMVAPERVQARERREVRAQAATPETLLAAWIAECLYVYEIEGFVVRNVEVVVCSDTLAHGLLHGEPVESGGHRIELEVKGTTRDELAVGIRNGVHETRIIVET